MWKYVVTWCIAYTSITSPPPSYDQWGRMLNNNSLVLNTEINYDCNNKKAFYDHDSAYLFYQETLNEIDRNPGFPNLFIYSDYDGIISSCKIDSEYVDTSLYGVLMGNDSLFLSILWDTLSFYSLRIDIQPDTLKAEILISCKPVVCVIDGYIIDGWDGYVFYDENWNEIEEYKIWDYKINYEVK